MSARTRTTVLISAALVAACALAETLSAAPPRLGVGDRMLIDGATARRLKPLAEASPLAEAGTATIVPGVLDLIVPSESGGSGDAADSGSGDSGGSSGSGSSGGGDSSSSDPDWLDIVEGIGGILRPGRGGSGHHPGHHGGYHPDYYPDYTPGYHPGYVPDYRPPGAGSSSSSHVPSNPLPDAPTDSGAAVVVSNPEKNGASISFVAGGQRFTLAPGYQQVIRRSGSVEVRFDRGGSFGTARYTLRDGTFQFLVTDEGWNLFRKVYRVTLDNTANDFDFRFLLGNTVHVVKAHTARDYEESKPLIVTFDPGNGRPDRRALESGSYRIAFKPDLRLWDLVQADAEADLPDMASNLPPSPPLPMGM